MSLDRQLFLWVQGFTGQPLIDELMVFLAEFLILLVPVTLLFIWFKGMDFEARELSAFTFFTTVTGLILSYVMGVLFFHQEPSAVFQTIASPSGENAFPSQHTTVILAAAAPLLYRGRRKLGALLLSAGLLTGFTRIYVGAHWPVDILGAVLAASISLPVSRFIWSRTVAIWRPLLEIYGTVEDEVLEEIRSFF